MNDIVNRPDDINAISQIYDCFTARAFPTDVMPPTTADLNRLLILMRLSIPMIIFRNMERENRVIEWNYYHMQYNYALSVITGHYFEKMAVELPLPDWSPDDFITKAQQLTNKTSTMSYGYTLGLSRWFVHWQPRSIIIRLENGQHIPRFREAFPSACILSR